jgi:hypothetical protein
LWPKTGRRFRSLYGAAAGALVAAWIVTVIGGYAGDWGWTGYSGNTLWEWVQLFLAPIAITTFVVPELVTLVAGNVDDNESDQTSDRRRLPRNSSASSRASRQLVRTVESAPPYLSIG